MHPLCVWGKRVVREGDSSRGAFWVGLMPRRASPLGPPTTTTRTQEAAEWFRAHHRQCNKAAAALLVRHQLPEAAVESLHALCAFPSVVPGVAHALLQRFGSLGALMDYVLDPERCMAWHSC